MRIAENPERRPVVRPKGNPNKLTYIRKVR